MPKPLGWLTAGSSRNLKPGEGGEETGEAWKKTQSDGEEAFMDARRKEQ